MVLSCRFEPGFYGKSDLSSSQFATTPIRRFEFHKRRQLFICAHNEALTAAMRVSNEDYPPARING
jgi:hypothetical protein